MRKQWIPGPDLKGVGTRLQEAVQQVTRQP